MPRIAFKNRSPSGRSSGRAARRLPRSAALGAAGLLGLAATGCVSQAETPVSPEQTVVAFSRALAAGELQRAYGLMSDDYRTRVTFKEFEKLLTENHDEALALSEALAQVRGRAQQHAVVHYEDDGELRLQRAAEGQWFISSDAIDFYDQSTPRAALRAFVRAMERRRYDVVIRLVPEADKEGVTQERMREAWSGDGREEVERLISNLRNHMDAPIEVVGDHAIMPYGDHLRMQFVREDGVWKIEDPE